MNNAYVKQVRLLLAVLPEVAKETVFALHGGTAINLFVRDMPRLSVDIDLTYVPIADRESSLADINRALQVLRQRLENRIPDVLVKHNTRTCKLQVTTPDAAVKVEVNTIGRGALGETRYLQLCDAAQTAYGAFCAIAVVSHAQLYGAKLCAALDRQHPRDLFDVRYLIDEGGGLDDDVRCGLIYALLSSNRPTHELLEPHFLDQRTAFYNQFAGMASVAFSYAEYESTRRELVEAIRRELTDNDKAFLLRFNQLQPDWQIHDFEHFPAIRWKQMNLERLSRNDRATWQSHLHKLEAVLDG